MAEIDEERKIMVGDVIDLFERLQDYYEFEDAVKWFRLPQPLLEGKTPADLISQGRAVDLHRVWDNLDAGAFI